MQDPLAKWGEIILIKINDTKYAYVLTNTYLGRLKIDVFRKISNKVV